MADLAAHLSGLSAASFVHDEPGRLALLSAAKALVARLEHPFERMFDIVWSQPILTLCLKTAHDMGVFDHLGGGGDSSSSNSSGRIKSDATATVTPPTTNANPALAAAAAAAVPPPAPSPPTTDLATLARKTNTDPALLRRILRVLVCGDVLAAPQPDAYAANAFARALREQPGLRQGIDVVYASTLPDVANLPEYLRFHNYRNLRGTEGQQPWEWIFSITPSQYANIWDFMRAEMPARYAAFNGFLSAVRAGQPAWTAAYPVRERVLKGWRRGTVLCVDVGGGLGMDLGHLAELLEGRADDDDENDDEDDDDDDDDDDHGKGTAAAATTAAFADARLVLEETPTLLDSLSTHTHPHTHPHAPPLHARIETLAHDFFTPQPVRGARLYFLRSVLHDWPDYKAREILLWLKQAMTPAYSKILIIENVMPEAPQEAGMLAAVMDVNVMAHFSSLERSERDWRDLIEGVGLRITRIVPFARKPSAAIEVEL